MELSEDGKSYSIKSSVNKSSVVDLKFTQAAPGILIGKDGTSYFGTDPQKPWGRMIHRFWPKCDVEGHILTQNGPVDFKGKGLFIPALQGMKPHFAGKTLRTYRSLRGGHLTTEQPQNGISPISLHRTIRPS